MKHVLIQPTNAKIALAHLTSRPKQALVAVLSVVFGISMYIFLNGFLSGVNNVQTDLAFSTLSHIRVYNDLPEDDTNLLVRYEGNEGAAINLRNAKVIQYTEGIKNSEKYIDLVSKNPEVAAIAPQVNLNVFFRNGAVKLNGVLSGIQVDDEEALFNTSKYIEAGNLNELKYRMDGIILGRGLVKKLSLKLNDNVLVTTADGVTRNFKLIGILRTTLANVDNTKGYIRISTARQLESRNMSYVTDIQVNIKNYDDARAVAGRLSEVIPYKVEPWMEANGQLESANELRDILAVAVSLTILLVAGFGIYNIMNMTVNEKIKEIAILKAMGFEGEDIVEIFLAQSVIIGLLGGIVGMGLGYLISVVVHSIPYQILILDTLPMTYHLKNYILAFFFGLITTYVAGYLPAKKASRVDPVEIIRG